MPSLAKQGGQIMTGWSPRAVGSARRLACEGRAPAVNGWEERFLTRDEWQTVRVLLDKAVVAMVWTWLCWPVWKQNPASMGSGGVRGLRNLCQLNAADHFPNERGPD
jgi:hypothetical protein